MSERITPFQWAQAERDVTRYEELDHICGVIYAEMKQVESWDDVDIRHKYEDRPLNHREVYLRGMNEVANIIDGRMGLLAERSG